MDREKGGERGGGRGGRKGGGRERKGVEWGRGRASQASNKIVI